MKKGLKEIKESYRVVKGKIVISNFILNIDNQLISFQIDEIYMKKLDKLKLVIRERKSKIEWIEYLSDNKAKKNGLIVLNLNNFNHKFCQMVSRWDFYIVEENDESNLINEYRLGIFNKEIQAKHERYYSSISTSGTNLITPYFTTNNGLSIVINQQINLTNEKVNFHMSLYKFHMKKNNIHGKIKLELPEIESYKIKSLLLIYRNKNEQIKYEFSVFERKRSNKSFVDFNIDISQVLFENYYWDFYLLLEMNEEEYYLRIKNPTFNVKRSINRNTSGLSFDFQNGYWVYPYITAVNTIALIYKEKEEYEKQIYRFKESIAYYIYILMKWYFDRKEIWIAYEKFSEGAQDNAYFFFKNCYEDNKKRNFYYIIKKDSPDYKNLIGMEDKVVEYMSFKYMLYIFSAKLLVSSESKGHVYNIRAQKGKIKQILKNKKIVFLQHGVIGLKKIDHIYKKTSSNAVDLFVVSSQFEKEIVKNTFGYKEEEIIITGLSRWDQLNNKSVGKKSILLMPTWRSWMDDIPEEKFIDSDYYRYYVALLNSPELERILIKYDIELNFYIHPKFKAYINKFSSPNERMRVYQFGEERLNELLMNASLLVTDYSSVAWDMYYQKKPIIFYHFDYEDYIKYQGSYIDMENELFGDRVFGLPELITLINDYADNNFAEKYLYAQKRNMYFEFVDKNNTERIYSSIEDRKGILKKKKGKHEILKMSKNNEFLRFVWRLMGKNKLTFALVVNIKVLLQRKHI
ncbi:CDP-glycerol glycerophosphotransferase family protein [Peribacillus sp. TH16]|uniref:CDP-glycerol glycerophosphotransferase family protein n=1 Tax=Peribacillus sp. TH16 TaxID=2798482 RepID=UPI001A91AB12|nr:CDP-glycerol glycerophosphotransferase family protein [Peribacillus sp. TH16]